MNTHSQTGRILPLLLIGACALLAGVGLGSLLLEQPERPLASPMTAITVLPTQRELPEFSLLDQEAAEYTVANLENQWTLLFLGFTSCGHVCPMTLAEMRTIRDSLDGRVNVVFVSVDPGRDTPEVIRKYIKGFDASFTGVTGAPEQLDALANALGAPYFVDADPDNYSVDHSSALFLINESAALAGVISQPLDVQAVVNELDALL